MKYLFPIIYLLTIFFYFSFGGKEINFLPLNYSQLSVIILLICCCIEDKIVFADKNIKTYTVFLIFYFISSIITGYITDFFHFLIPYVLYAYVAYWSTKILVVKYQCIWPLLSPLIIVGIINSIVTIMQALGIPISNSFLNFFISDIDEEFLLMNDSNFGVSLRGIYQSAVFNGHYLLFCFLASLLMIIKSRKIILYLPALLIYIGLICCQQRGAFLLATLAALLLIIIKIRKLKKGRFILTLILIVLFCYFFPRFIHYMIDVGSRLSDYKDLTNRNIIWKESISYILSYPIFGGLRRFISSSGSYPHNFFLSAFMAGGILGGLTLMIFLINQIKTIVKYSARNYSFLAISLMFIALFGDSMFHNVGLVEADFSIIVSCSLLTYAQHTH